ncbi:MAG: preprotein translocase subunit SecG [Lachnospiraceae bacterium]|nr:preprotein translocase subunit SecG [Lachnospiraceae bacterium]
MLRTVFTIIFILICIALTVIVLVQEGKNAGLGAIGGLGDTYWGKNKARSMEGKLVKFTKFLAIGFIVIAVFLNVNF